MKFESYPFDNHNCYLELVNWLGASYRVQLQSPKLYVWNDQAGQELLGHIVDKESNRMDYFFRFESLPPENFYETGYDYSMFRIKISFNRTEKGQAKIFSSYHIPIAVYACLSLVSYGIELEQVPGRMGLLITLSLIMINTYNSVDAPNNRGFSNIEVWFALNLFPALFAILEYGLLLTVKKFVSKAIWILGKPFSIQALAKTMDFAALLSVTVYLIIVNVHFWLFSN